MLAPTHLVLLGLLIVLALVVFGPKRLPELGSSVGRAINEFKRASAQATHGVTVHDLTGPLAATPVVTPAGFQEVAPPTATANGLAPTTAGSAVGEVAGH